MDQRHAVQAAVAQPDLVTSGLADALLPFEQCGWRCLGGQPRTGALDDAFAQSFAQTACFACLRCGGDERCPCCQCRGVPCRALRDAFPFHVSTATVVILAPGLHGGWYTMRYSAGMTHALVTGWGKCLPPAVLSNADLATFLDTSDEWIRTRTGIRERRISHVGLTELAEVAARRALAAAMRW